MPTDTLQLLSQISDNGRLQEYAVILQGVMLVIGAILNIFRRK